MGVTYTMTPTHFPVAATATVSMDENRSNYFHYIVVVRKGRRQCQIMGWTCRGGCNGSLAGLKTQGLRPHTSLFQTPRRRTEWKEKAAAIVFHCAPLSFRYPTGIIEQRRNRVLNPRRGARAGTPSIFACIHRTFLVSLFPVETGCGKDRKSLSDEPRRPP